MTGRPLAILNSSKDRPGVSFTAASTSLRKDSSGWERKAWMMTSRRPRSVSTVDSYASWHASGNSWLLRWASIWCSNFFLASDFKPLMPYLQECQWGFAAESGWNDAGVKEHGRHSRPGRRCTLTRCCFTRCTQKGKGGDWAPAVEDHESGVGGTAEAGVAARCI